MHASNGNFVEATKWLKLAVEHADPVLISRHETNNAEMMR
jgi:hypothetical protein